jgi:hypothetical protein
MLRPGQLFFVFALAFVLRSTGLIQGDRDGLAATLHFAGLSPWSAFQFAKFEFRYDTACGFPLAG